MGIRAARGRVVLGWVGVAGRRTRWGRAAVAVAIATARIGGEAVSCDTGLALGGRLGSALGNTTLFEAGVDTESDVVGDLSLEISDFLDTEISKGGSGILGRQTEY